MKFELKGPLKENIYNLMRDAGYHFLRKNEQINEFEFARPSRGYPRFHLFLIISEKEDIIIFNLHLDQKKPSYKGASAHSGEYQGQLVEEEAKRIANIF